MKTIRNAMDIAEAVHEKLTITPENQRILDQYSDAIEDGKRDWVAAGANGRVWDYIAARLL